MFLKKSLFVFDIHIDNTIIELSKDYYDIIYNLSEKIHKIFDNNIHKEENNLFVGLTEELYNKNISDDIEKISQIIIPQLEKNIYGCYLNLTRAYVYKNKISNDKESR